MVMNSKNLKNISDYFDKLSDRDSKDLSLYTNAPLYRKYEINKFMDFGGLLNCHYDILEIGAGRGNYTIPLLCQGHRVSVIDISKKSLEVLQSNVKSLKVHKNLVDVFYGDISSFLFEKKYDVIIGVDVLHHIVDKSEELNMLFRKFQSLLRSSGKIVFKEPNPIYPWRLYFSLSPTMNWVNERGTQYMTKSNFKCVLEKNNFKEIKFKNIDLLPFVDRSKFLFELGKLINDSFIINFFSSSHLVYAEIIDNHIGN